MEGGGEGQLVGPVGGRSCWSADDLFGRLIADCSRSCGDITLYLSARPFIHLCKVRECFIGI